jgi:hypothetical protein
MVTSDRENGAFDTDDSFDVLAQSPNDVESGLATFEYTAPDGSSVTGTILADENGDACEANGHLMAS